MIMVHLVTIGSLLRGHSQVRVAIYKRYDKLHPLYGKEEIIGGFFYIGDNRPSPISLDGGTYSLDTTILDSYWQDDNTLKVVVRRNDY